MKLSQVGELRLINQIRQRFRKTSRYVTVGIGDDAAVVKPIKKDLIVTTDMMVEGVHFDLSFITTYQLGFKLVSVNVSDIYAMGGRPRYLLLNIATREDTAKEALESFFDGVEKAMRLYDLTLIGGDLSSSKEGIALSATLIGYAQRHIRRSGAKAGDRIYVTGNLGDSACGLQLLKRIKRHVHFEESKQLEGVDLPWDVVEPLLRRHLMPEVKDPRRFARDITAMIDISDGFLIDLSRLCDESKTGARVYLESIPVSSELKIVAPYLGISPIKLALSGGEDYEFLFTAPATKKVNAIHIGEITESERVIVDSSGKEDTFSAEGYQHFSSTHETTV